MFRLGYWRHETQIEREAWPFRLSKDHSFYRRDYMGILNVSEKVNRHPLMIGNRIEALYDGEEAYPAMLEAIEKAEKFIYLCSYIFNSDETGLRFVKALADAQKRGVQVWVLVDAFGELYSSRRISRILWREGITCSRFLPLSLSLNSLHLNLRNHRKLLVIDGRLGFTGGMNIRDSHWALGAQKKKMTDIQFKVQGPVVLELQEVFLEDWYFATHESLSWLVHPHELLPGDSVCRIISGGPNEDFEKINWMLLGALAWSKNSVQIMTPYFVPDPVLISALNTAALRGVLVEVILPEKNNLPFVAWANRALHEEMVENEIKIYYQPAPFSHSKLFVVDSSYTLIGSSNWDARSLRLNFELDLEIYDSNFSKEMSDYFVEVRDRAREVTLTEIKNDPLWMRFRDSFFKLFSPYL